MYQSTKQQKFNLSSFFKIVKLWFSVKCSNNNLLSLARKVILKKSNKNIYLLFLFYNIYTRRRTRQGYVR